MIWRYFSVLRQVMHVVFELSARVNVCYTGCGYFMSLIRSMYGKRRERRFPLQIWSTFRASQKVRRKLTLRPSVVGKNAISSVLLLVLAAATGFFV